MTAGLILAAGRSRRMGSAKLVLPWRDGRTVIENVVTSMMAAGFRPVIVVLGADGERIETALEGVDVGFAWNKESGNSDMLRSIQIGLEAFEPEVTGAAVLPGDMPQISPTTLKALAAAAASDPGSILAPVHGGRKGHPVILPRRCWGEVLSLEAGDTLRTFLRRHEAEIVRIEADDPGIHADLDTPDEYRAAR